MAARDVMPFISHEGGHTSASAYPVGAGTVADSSGANGWEIGEILRVDAAAGDVNKAAAGAITLDGTYGVAAIDSNAAQKIYGDGTDGSADGELAPLMTILVEGDMLVSSVSFNGTGTPEADVTNHVIGDAIGLRVGTGLESGFDRAGTGLIVERILDATRKDVSATGAGTAALVVARVL